MEALPDRATYTRLVWRREYECGYPTLDAQHRLLFEAGNDLLSAILEQRDKLDVELLLDDLIGHVEHHFHEEEAIMAQASHPVSPEHRTRHEELLARVKALGENYHGGSLTVADLFTFIADDLVVQHILKDDLRFLADTDRPASVGA
jgi:hemerythrin-like metal-binding protein